jgi:hypothetical protein
VLVPLSVSVPGPILVSPPLPEIVPENVVLVLSLPMNSVAAPSVTAPAPATEPTFCSKPLRSSVAPLAIVRRYRCSGGQRAAADLGQSAAAADVAR